MAKLKFTSFIPVLTQPAVFNVLKDNNLNLIAQGIRDKGVSIEPFLSQDPSPTSWRSAGLINAFKDDLIYEIEPGKHLMAVQFNERILPSTVRDEYLAKEVQKFNEREGRAIGKKDYAMLKEEVEFSLLPKAFLRRSVTPVIFIAKQKLVLICTTSPKRAEDTVAILRALFDAQSQTATTWAFVTPENSLVGQMTAVAKDGFNSDEHQQFMITDNAVLRGEGKQTIRIKDKDVEGHDVVQLLKQAYDVHELGLSYDPTGNDESRLLSFTLSDKMVFKRLKFDDGAAKIEYGETETKDDQIAAVMWLTARTYADMLVALMAEFGGYKSLSDLKREAKEEAKAAVKANAVDPLNEDDDESL